MPPLYRLLSLRYLWHRWDRALLVILSIALGVATVVSSRTLNQCIQSAADDATTPLGMGDLFVTNGEFGVALPVYEDLKAAKLPGVKALQPLILERVYLPGQGNRAAVLFGVELGQQLLAPSNDLGVTVEPTGEGPLLQLAGVWALQKQGKGAEALAAWRAIPGRLVLISQALQDERVRLGETGKPLLVRVGNRVSPCTPVAVFAFPDNSPLAALGKNLIGLELIQAARLTRPGVTPGTAALAGGLASEAVADLAVPPRLNRIDVVLEPGADKLQAQAAVEAVARDRASVRTPETQGSSTQEIISGVQIAFTLCSAAAMVVGLFLVYNALAVTVAERRPDIGILRSIGATRAQIVTLFAVAALVLGLVGVAVGVPLGTLMARGVLIQFREELGALFLNPEQGPTWPSVSTILLATAAGVCTAVFAALLPAIQAATQDPADAVRRSPAGAKGLWRLAHRLTCVAMVGGGVAMIFARHQLPHRVGAFGGMMTALVGLLLSAPILVTILVRFVNPVLRRVLPIEARLAADNLLRAPGRTGVVIGALGAGVAVMIQTAGVGKSNEDPVKLWLAQVIQADRFVFGGNLAEATSSQTPLEPEIRAEFAKLPGVAGTAGFRYVRPEYNGTIIFLLAIDVKPYCDNTSVRAGNTPEKFARLAGIAGRPAVAVSENFVRRHGKGVGDTITLPGPRGPVELPIEATVVDYSWSRGTVFIDRAVYAELFQDPLMDLCHVYLSDPDAPDADKALRQACSDRGLTVQDRVSVMRFLAELIDRVYLLAYLQQLVVGLVAALGVVTALLISVLQRKRELGLLLAVGATPAQVVRTVLAEALLMGGFGTFFGILIGIPMEYYVLKVVMVEESGFVFDLVVPWKQGIGIAAGALLVATVAGLLPALHAVRTRIPEAIAYE